MSTLVYENGIIEHVLGLAAVPPGISGIQFGWRKAGETTVSRFRHMNTFYCGRVLQTGDSAAPSGCNLIGP